jgi:hypothetical protein
MGDNLFRSAGENAYRKKCDKSRILAAGQLAKAFTKARIRVAATCAIPTQRGRIGGGITVPTGLNSGALAIVKIVTIGPPAIASLASYQRQPRAFSGEVDYNRDCAPGLRVGTLPSDCGR